ncbi:hypothetical protein PIB30_083629 [Stylosanthes scabra]|uniref:Uncharacterized protein n=1 Tax=Stylosanthes scabra TaxID=79078 RepID=A0ABU6RS65_9FABA|nr:hypothetical protein [Stylosanthes scabra]
MNAVVAGLCCRHRRRRKGRKQSSAWCRYHRESPEQPSLLPKSTICKTSVRVTAVAEVSQWSCCSISLKPW